VKTESCLIEEINTFKISGFSDFKLKVLRLDLIDTYYGGNKFFKLKYNLEEAKQRGDDTLFTFGGTYSNHIAATAAVGKKEGFKTIGIIRGDKVLPLNKTLQFATDNEMQLEFISREEYRNKTSETFLNSLQKKYGKFYLLPEGGSNKLAVEGCKEIIDLIDVDFDYIVCPTATGATLTGIASALKLHQTAIGICVLKNEKEIKDFVTVNISKEKKLPEIISDYHFNGYAKTNGELITFVNNFKLGYQVNIEPIYTGKMFYGLFDLVNKNYFKKGSTVISIHTGGLQYL
jgi:1-aminocyclopropane-1-carboxylate deaminase